MYNQLVKNVNVIDCKIPNRIEIVDKSESNLKILW